MSECLSVYSLNTPLIILFIQWEPGFNGGFTQHFETKIREVSTDKVITGETEGSLLRDGTTQLNVLQRSPR